MDRTLFGTRTKEMEALKCFFLLICVCFVFPADGRKTYQDMFPHTHKLPGKFPFPIPPIPGWDPDTNPWDDYLYPPINPKLKDLTHRRGKPTVRLTSDSPALNGSSISFTAKLEYPPCQKEDARGDLVWDEHCEDANGQVRSGYVFNWTSWMDDYGFGRCTDSNRCNVFPDGKPFPQSNDWRRKSYVYVWHTMGQYYETCDGSASTLTLNTTSIPLGAEVMEVMVYRKRERRKYTPLSADNTVFYVTDKIPVAVVISQKAAVNESANVFFRGEDVVFKVLLHDPSGYLKTAAAIDYIWDFRDGNQLVTHRNVTTHTYSTLGVMNVKLVVEAAFPVDCPPAAATPTPVRSTSPPPTAAPTSATHAVTKTTETTEVLPSTSTSLPASSPVTMTTGLLTTEPLPSTVAGVTPESNRTMLPWLRSRRPVNSNECFRYVHGAFTGNITIIEPKHTLRSPANSRIVNVSAARVTKTDISFLVKCLGSFPTSACTIVSDPTCTQVRSIICDDVQPSAACEVHLTRTFLEPGTYCVNITLEDSSSLALASTTVTINKSQDAPVSETHTANVVLSASALLVTVFALIAYLVYRRYKVYRPIRRSLLQDTCSPPGVRGRLRRLRVALFPSNEESHHLLTERLPR